jgi:acyl-CoA synthetase (NDP forming)
VTNPIDLIASAGGAAYLSTIPKLLASDDVDCVLAIYTTIDSARTSEILAAIASGVAQGREAGFGGKPVVVCTMAAANTPPLQAGVETLPVYEFPEQAARALVKAAAYATWRNAPAGALVSFDNLLVKAGRDLCRDIVKARGDSWLTTQELHQLLHAADLKLAPGVLAHSADEAAALACVFGYPVVAKLTSAKALHKTDVGGVRLHLANEQAVRTAYADLYETAVNALGGAFEGILIQPMVSTGTETLVGLTRDAMFGPLVAFGLGGTQVELFRDVTFRIAPLTDRDADEMIHGVRGFALLDGYRNKPRADVAALRDVLLKVSYLAAQIPELAELEFNPVMVLPSGHGCQIVDARARVASQSSATHQ